MSVKANAPILANAACGVCGRRTHVWKAWLRGNAVIGKGFWYYVCAWHKRRFPGLEWSRVTTDAKDQATEGQR